MKEIPENREEADKVVRNAFGRRPDFLDGKEYVDEVRGHITEIPEIPILSDQKMMDLARGISRAEADHAIAREVQKDMLRWFVEWGDEICMPHGMRKRRRCDKCWQELKDKLAELEGRNG